jgi:hypothetical protein
MVNNYYIPQKTNGAVPKPEIKAAVRQSVEEAVRAALPQSIHAQQLVLRFYITVNIHLPS